MPRDICGATLSSERQDPALSSERPNSASSSEQAGPATGPRRRLVAGDTLFYALWGSAGVVAYTLLFLRFGAAGAPGDLVRDWNPRVVWWLFALVHLLALATSMTHLLRSSDHAAPAPGVRRLYAGAWLLSFLLAVPPVALIHASLPPELAGVLAVSVVAHLTGVAHLFGAAVWRDGLQFVYGVAISLSIPLAVSAGPDGYALVYATVIGGGGLLAALLCLNLRRRGYRSERPVS